MTKKHSDQESEVTKQPEAEQLVSEEETAPPQVEELQKQLAEEKKKAEDYLAGWQRAQADFINYKRRAEQEKEDNIKYANNNLIIKLLPVLDDFELAFAAIPAEETEAAWVKGIKVVERKMRNVLESIGISEIKATGEQFDPNVHEAVMQSEGPEGLILQEFQKGYKIGDRVIRASKVSVGRGEPEKDKEES
jgi:molecular chaperone GrpE